MGIRRQYPPSLPRQVTQKPTLTGWLLSFLLNPSSIQPYITSMMDLVIAMQTSAATMGLALAAALTARWYIFRGL
jgi:hypothetical protein